MAEETPSVFVPLRPEEGEPEVLDGQGVPEEDGYEVMPPKSEGVVAGGTEDDFPQPKPQFDLPFPTLPTTSPFGTKLLKNLETEIREKDTQIRRFVGEDYDPSTTLPDSFGLVFDMNRNLALQDKQKKFKSAYPNGRLISVPTATGNIIMGQTEIGEPFRELPLGPQVASTFASAEGALSMGGSILHPAYTFGGAFLGNLIDNYIEQERGFSNQVSYLDALKVGGVAVATDIATRGVGRIFFGPKHPADAAKAMADAVQASKELDLKPLAIGQLSGVIRRGMFQQIARTSPRVQNILTEQQQRLKVSLETQAAIPEGSTIQDMMAVVRAQTDELDSLINPSGLTRPNAFAALQRGLKNYKNAGRHVRDRLYTHAIGLADDVQMDLIPAFKVAVKLGAGVRARVPGPIPGVKQLRRISKGPAGERAEMDDLLLDIIDMSKANDGLITNTGTGELKSTAFEQIKALRERAFDLKHSDTPRIRRDANEVYTALTRVMDNPVSGDPGFIAAWRNANYFNRQFETNLDFGDVTRMIQTDSPERIASKFFNPGFSKELGTIRALVPETQWEQFANGFRTDILHMEKGQTALTRMDNFKSRDPDGWALLVSPRQEREMRNILVRKSQINKSPVRKLIREELTEGERILSLAREGKVGQLVDIMNKSGGVTSPLAEKARAAVYKDILDFSTTTNKQGIDVIDALSLVDRVDFWRASGKLTTFMRESDFRTLELYRQYAVPMTEAGDVGGGMMAGQLRQQIIKAGPEAAAGRFGTAKRVFRTIWGNELTARFLSRPQGADRIMMGQTNATGVMASMAVAAEVYLRGQSRENVSDKEAEESLKGIPSVSVPLEFPEENSQPEKDSQYEVLPPKGGEENDTLDLPEGMEEIEPGVFRDQQGRIFDLEVAQ